MENLGSLAVLLAFCLSVFASAAAVVGGWKRNAFLIHAAERAVYSIWFLLTAAAAVIVISLLTGDFRFAYVAAHSNRAMPALYKYAAWWGGQEGSLLLWSWLLAGYSAIVVFTNRRKHRSMMPYVMATLLVTQCFFLILNAFVASPFQMIAVGRSIQSVPDGQGLNPLLQYPAMAIHPPMLYLGYVGFAVPFAFAIGSLITRQPGDDWIHTTRRWTLVTWLFQSTRNHPRRGLGVRGPRLGRILELGPGRERLLPPLGHRHGVSALGDDAGEEGHDEGLEHGADFEHLLPLHLRHLPDALRRRQLGPRLRAILHRPLVRRLPRDHDRWHRIPHPGSPGLPENRSAPGERGLARVEFHVQQPDPAGGLLRHSVGYAVPGDLRSGHGRKDHGRPSVFQPDQRSDRAVPALPDRCRAAVRLAADLAR